MLHSVLFLLAALFFVLGLVFEELIEVALLLLTVGLRAEGTLSQLCLLFNLLQHFRFLLFVLQALLSSLIEVLD